MKKFIAKKIIKGVKKLVTKNKTKPKKTDVKLVTKSTKPKVTKTKTKTVSKSKVTQQKPVVKQKPVAKQKPITQQKSTVDKRSASYRAGLKEGQNRVAKPKKSIKKRVRNTIIKGGGTLIVVSPNGFNNVNPHSTNVLAACATIKNLALTIAGAFNCIVKYWL